MNAHRYRFTGWYAKVEAAAFSFMEKVTSGRFWLLKSALAASCVSLFLAFPSYQDNFENGQLRGRTWKAVFKKSENLKWNVLEEFGPSTNAARVNFRLTGPVLGKLLGVNTLALTAAQGAAGILLLGICAFLGARVGGSRAAGLMAAIGVGGTWAGATSFCELRGVFDGIALSALMGAMAARGFLTGAALVFLACWTDERAIVAFPLLVIASWWIHGRGAGQESSPQGAAKVLWGMAAGLIAHFVSRYFYARWAGLPHRFDGNGLDVLLNQINIIPMGMWLGLEGGWLPVFGGIIVAWLRGWRMMCALLLAGLATVLAVSFAVVDVSRTTAFLLPALFAGIGMLRNSETESDFKTILFVSAAVSVVWPMYYVGGKSTIWWAYPLPLQVVRIAIGR